MSHNFELLQLATLCLSRDGPVKERLAEAYSEHLASLDAEELPEGVREEFGALRDAMQRERPLSRESAVRASIRKMSVSEASRYAALVVRLFAALARAELTQPLAARTPRAAPVVHLFASEG
jgi:hypothetical protein